MFGYHCRGLVGHTVLTVSQGAMLGFKPTDITFESQFGVLETALVTDRPAPATAFDQTIQEEIDDADDNTAVKTIVNVKKRRH